MQTRMEKYTDAHEETSLRFKKNEELYKKISEQELKKYSVSENATVLGDNTPLIDVEHIKKILETRYNELPKRKSIVIPEDTEEEKEEIVETKEYDINLILEKAKEKDQYNYDKNRFKKIRDTQYDILKDLNLNTDVQSSSSSMRLDDDEKNELMELINTITQKELENKNMKDDEELDFFDDLKGSENTVVLEPINNESTSTNSVEIKKYVDDDTFYTSTTSFTQSDFDDFDDLKKEVRSNKVIMSVVTFLVIVMVVIVILLLLDKFLGISFI